MEQTEQYNFFTLLKPHYSDALRYCRSICANKHADDAEDVLQQSLLKAMENFDGLNEHSKFKQWLFRIITNCFYDSIRGSIWKKFLQLDSYEGRENIPDIYNQYEMSDKSELLNKALAKLNAKERVSILLFEVSQFSIEEIVEIQNEKSLSTVKSRLSRTREKLKNIIIRLENDNLYKTNEKFTNDVIKKPGKIEIL